MPDLEEGKWEQCDGGHRTPCDASVALRALEGGADAVTKCDFSDEQGTTLRGIDRVR